MSCFDKGALEALAEKRAMQVQADEAFRRRVAKLVAEGLPDSLIAQRLGCGASRVQRARRASGLQAVGVARAYM